MTYDTSTEWGRKMQTRVDEIVAAAPPLTEEQKHIIRTVLRGGPIPPARRSALDEAMEDAR
jgi:hypothetical protein